MSFIIVEGDFPFWREFLIAAWQRLPGENLLLSQVPGLWRAEDYGALERLPLTRDGALDAHALRAIVAQRGPFVGAFTIFEPAVGRTLEIQRALGLPEIAGCAPRQLRNKAAMVETVRAAGLDVPMTVYGGAPGKLLDEALATLSFPVISKPAELAGKAGVKLSRDRGELAEALEVAFAETLPFEIDGQPTSVVEAFGCERGVLVQEYIEGPEFSVEGYVAAGAARVLAVTEKLHSGPPLFEELGHLQPARIAAADEAAIRDYTTAAVRAFELRNTWFHFELRLSRRGPVMMELNARVAGDMIGRLLELRSGISLGDAIARVAAGEELRPPAKWLGAAGVRMVTVDRGGTLRAIRAPTLHSEREAAVFEPRPGAVVHAPKPGGVTRVGYVIASAGSAAAVEERLAGLVDAIQVELEPCA